MNFSQLHIHQLLHIVEMYVTFYLLKKNASLYMYIFDSKSFFVFILASQEIFASWNQLIG